MAGKRKAVFALLSIFACGACFLGLVYWNFPTLDASERARIKLPTKLEDAKELGRVLSRYKDKYYYVVLTGLILTYIFLQSFAIPGSIFLSVLSGYLFKFPIALTLVCSCSAVGASLCYLLSYLLGRPLLMFYFPEKVRTWSEQVAQHREDLFNLILFLRITPFLPNWFINVTSPILDVPVWPFFWGTFLGVAPPSIVAIQTGKTLLSMTAAQTSLNWRSLLVLVVLGLAALAPIAFKHWFRNRLKLKDM